MRRLKLEGSKAMYTRLLRVNDLGKHDLEVDPSYTAPFTVRNKQDRVLIMLEDTLVAVLDPTGPELNIRDQYPEEYDRALLRALRNVSGFVEEMNRIERDGVKNKTALLAREYRNSDFSFDFKGNIDEALDDRITVSKYDGKSRKLEIKHGNSSVNLVISKVNDDYRVKRIFSSSYMIKKEVIEQILVSGQQFWNENFNTNEMINATTTLRKLENVDKFTITDEFEIFLKQPYEILKNMPLLHDGHFTVRPAFVRGLCVGADALYKGILVTSPVPCLFDEVDSDTGALIKEQTEDLRLRWKAKVCGLDVNRMPQLSKEGLLDTLEKQDFGYDI